MTSTSAGPLEHSCALGATIADFPIGGFGPFGDFSAEDQCKIRWIGVVELPTKRAKVTMTMWLASSQVDLRVCVDLVLEKSDGHAHLPQAVGDDSGERRSSLSQMSHPRDHLQVRTPPQAPGDRVGERRSSLSQPRHPRDPRPDLLHDHRDLLWPFLTRGSTTATPSCHQTSSAVEGILGKGAGHAQHGGGAGVGGQPGGGCLGLH